MLFENSNSWTLNFIVAFSNIFFEFFVFNAKSSFQTSVILNTSSDIFKKFRMFFNNVNLFCNDDKNLMFNVDISS